MELRHMRYFVCVAEEMHFGRAAQRLGISQPPLSQQIRALEEELGTPLFERTSRRVRLTEAGRLFLPEARAALAQVERAAEVARASQRGEIGRLRLGFTASGPFVPKIADALYAFRQERPHVELVIQELGRDMQIEAIDQDRLDIGIVRAADPLVLPSGLRSRCVYKEEMLLTLREDHALALRETAVAISDLADIPFVLYGATGGAGFNENFFALCEEAGFRPRIAAEASSFATLLGLVAAGFGATVLARSLVRLHVESLVFRDITPPVTSRLWMIHKDHLPPAAAAFRDSLLTEEVV
jgi:DNA-binding transcriptional LysR family regulator